MRISRISVLLWGAYAVFVGLAFYLNWHERMFQFSGSLAMLKLSVWAVFLCFLAYSVYCSTREDLFRTIGQMSKLYWGRQIGADLYLGLFLGLIIVYLHGGIVAVLLWIIPTLAFANLAILLYFAIHFDAIADKLLI